MIKLGEKEVILFNGDSITDAGRDRGDRHSLAGYTEKAAAYVRDAFPDKALTFYNRGISGDRSADLLSRICGELSDIKPTVFCMLIGINDVWRKYDSGDATTAESYAQNINEILRCVREYTEKIIILEPFIIPSAVDRTMYYEDLMPKILRLREAAAAVKATYIPLDGIFAALTASDNSIVYSGDGVHLTDPGNEVVAHQIAAAVCG